MQGTKAWREGKSPPSTLSPGVVADRTFLPTPGQRLRFSILTALSSDHDLAAACARFNTLTTAIHFLTQMPNAYGGPLDVIAIDLNSPRVSRRIHFERCCWREFDANVP